jgi:2,4-dienoyl-CoA reductase-like NADH-dependent reductase (Old Yellow Enzyme family)
MSKLFEPTNIGPLILDNRFVRSATWEGLAGDDGSVTDRLIQAMVDLARGGVGLIITGHAYVLQEGQAGPWQLGVYKDELVPGLARMAQAVHAAGGKIVLQLAYAGVFGVAKPVRVVSDFPELGDKPRRELTLDDAAALPQAYAKAARRAREAGFDGIELHSAHGYLLSQFLSPYFNRRTDQYGGTIENRSRVHVEVLQAIREVVGPDYPILAKINGQDFAEGGLELGDSLEAARRLARAGLDAIELSGGLLTNRKLSPSRMGINQPEKEAYFREEAWTFRQAVNLPLILVGGIRSPEVAEALLLNGTADYFSMSRPFIREPGLVARWQSGDRSPAKCLSDNQCFAPGFKGLGVRCVVDHPENK